MEGSVADSFAFRPPARRWIDPQGEHASLQAGSVLARHRRNEVEMHGDPPVGNYNPILGGDEGGEAEVNAASSTASVPTVASARRYRSLEDPLPPLRAVAPALAPASE